MALGPQHGMVILGGAVFVQCILVLIGVYGVQWAQCKPQGVMKEYSFGMKDMVVEATAMVTSMKKEIKLKQADDKLETAVKVGGVHSAVTGDEDAAKHTQKLKKFYEHWHKVVKSTDWTLGLSFAALAFGCFAAASTAAGVLVVKSKVGLLLICSKVFLLIDCFLAFAAVTGYYFWVVPELEHLDLETLLEYLFPDEANSFVGKALLKVSGLKCDEPSLAFGGTSAIIQMALCLCTVLILLVAVKTPPPSSALNDARQPVMAGMELSHMNQGQRGP